MIFKKSRDAVVCRDFSEEAERPGVCALWSCSDDVNGLCHFVLIFNFHKLNLQRCSFGVEIRGISKVSVDFLVNNRRAPE